MQFSENWLREWVSPEASTQELADRLTMAGLEVEAVEPAAGAISGVVVGEVLSAERHPDADKLSLCRVGDGSEEFQVICGAPNVAAGQRVPFARVGARLPNGMKIRKAKIRGTESFGMICSEEELGMADSSDGILELPGDAPLGVDVVSLLGLDDQLIELGLTPNRSDCLGIAGLAREVSAIFDQSVAAPDLASIPAQHEQALSVRLEAPEACPRYACRVIRNVDVNAASPLWLKERLRRCGVRSIDPIVDVTNFVMLELGQPMHAFDLDRLDGGIVVRMARDGEKLALLDGSEVTLSSDSLLIADESKAVALAGIMGGDHSAVNEATRNILLESAFFAPLQMAGEARSHGMHTDASHRFERGVDFALQEKAIERATELLLAIVGGEPGPTVVAEQAEALPALEPIALRAARLEMLLGVAVAPEQVEAIFTRLGLPIETTDTGWLVTPTSWRYDIRIEADLIEEVARVYGYERIPVNNQACALEMRPQPETRLPHAEMRRRLVSLGYQEAITYSFVDPKLQALVDPDGETVALSNPISSDMAVMRTSLWPGLLQALGYNLNRQQSRVRLFESGQHFVTSDGELSQQEALAGLIAGVRDPEGWANDSGQVDFFDLKGDVEAVLRDQGGAALFHFAPGEHPALHPGQTAFVMRGDARVGVLGRLHPRLEKELGLACQVFLFELEYEGVHSRNLPNFNALSKFPEVRRDLALVVDRNLAAAELTAVVEEVAGDVLRDIKLFDMYVGQHVDFGKKSLAIGMVLQHAERTMTDDEVNDLVVRVVDTLGERCGAVLRN